MWECVITMKSATYAEKAKKAARFGGIGVQIVSIDPAVTKRGCAYGISLSCSDVQDMIRLLERKKIPYGEVLGERN